ncbi:hypothetical protein P8452_67132 [Trifolium repens]|nr:hypothetical protein P8452_67132 [Trifolium repens]
MGSCCSKPKPTERTLEMKKGDFASKIKQLTWESERITKPPKNITKSERITKPPKNITKRRDRSSSAPNDDNMIIMNMNMVAAAGILGGVSGGCGGGGGCAEAVVEAVEAAEVVVEAAEVAEVVEGVEEATS